MSVSCKGPCQNETTNIMKEGGKRICKAHARRPWVVITKYTNCMKFLNIHSRTAGEQRPAEDSGSSGALAQNFLASSGSDSVLVPALMTVLSVATPDAHLLFG